MKNKQQIRTFEGDLYFFDIIWTTGKGDCTFEVRSTSADNGATSTVTNNATLKELILDGDKSTTGMKESVWICSSDSAQQYADRTIGLLENESYLQQLEDAMNDDFASGKWISEEEFDDDDLAFDDDDDLDDDLAFDDDEQEEEFY